MARPDFAPAPDSDGYLDGARDRALVLDFCAQPVRARIHHSAATMNAEDFFVIWGQLARAGLVGANGVPLALTPAGLAAHAAAQRALADLAAGVAAAV